MQATPLGVGLRNPTPGFGHRREQKREDEGNPGESRRPRAVQYPDSKQQRVRRLLTHPVAAAGALAAAAAAGAGTATAATPPPRPWPRPRVRPFASGQTPNPLGRVCFPPRVLLVKFYGLFPRSRSVNTTRARGGEKWREKQNTHLRNAYLLLSLGPAPERGGAGQPGWLTQRAPSFTRAEQVVA